MDPRDPRPLSVTQGDDVLVRGRRCTDCRYPSAWPVTRCQVCFAPVVDDTFGPEGEVFASTVLRVGVPGYQPPLALAYLTLDDGPRVLVHTPGDQALPVGCRARLVKGGRDLLAVASQEGNR